MAKQEMFCS